MSVQNKYNPAFSKYTQTIVDFNGKWPWTNIMRTKTLGDKQEKSLFGNLDQQTIFELSNLSDIALIISKHSDIHVTSLEINHEQRNFYIYIKDDKDIQVKLQIEDIELKQETSATALMTIYGKIGDINLDIPITIRNKDDEHIVVDSTSEYLRARLSQEEKLPLKSLYCTQSTEGWGESHHKIYIKDNAGDAICVRYSELLLAKNAVEAIKPLLCHFRDDFNMIGSLDKCEILLLGRQSGLINSISFDPQKVANYHYKHDSFWVKISKSLGFTEPHADYCVMATVDNQERCFEIQGKNVDIKTEFSKNKLFYETTTKAEYIGVTTDTSQPLKMSLGTVSYGNSVHRTITDKTDDNILKVVLIAGKDIVLTPNIKALSSLPSHLLLEYSSTSTLISDILVTLNGRINDTTKIIILAHGNNVNSGEHVTSMFGPLDECESSSTGGTGIEDACPSTRTSYIFELLSSLTKTPLHINFISCFGGAASADITFLNKGSTLITYASSDTVSQVAANNWIVEKLLTEELGVQNSAQLFINQMRLFTEVATYTKHLGDKGTFSYQYNPEHQADLRALQEDFVSRMHKEADASMELNLNLNPLSVEELNRKAKLHFDYLRLLSHFHKDYAGLAGYLQDPKNKNFIQKVWLDEMSGKPTLVKLPLDLTLNDKIFNLLEGIGVDFSANNNPWSWSALTYVLYAISHLKLKGLFNVATKLIALDKSLNNEVLVPKSLVDEEPILTKKTHLTMVTDKGLLTQIANKYLENHTKFSPDELSHIAKVAEVDTASLSELFIYANKCEMCVELAEPPSHTNTISSWLGYYGYSDYITDCASW